MRFSLVATFLFVWSTAAQSISTILPEQNGLSTFTAYVSQFPELLALLDGGNFTVLAPTDDAFASFLGSETGINTTDTDELEALLQYHVLQGLHPSLSFASSPQFLPTLLTNNNYTNVTGGQRVEALSQNGTVSIYSAIKALSKIVTADALFVGGIIHSIDAVLAIPDTVPATITKAGLNDLVALLSKVGWLTNPDVLDTVTDLHDLTVFACNAPQCGGSFTGWDNLPNQVLQTIFEYAFVDGIVLYSPSLTNQSIFQTLEGKDVTITVTDGEIYVDASKIIASNYLTSNGVIQILDTPLNPNNTNARPTIAAGPTSSKSGLSSYAKALIGVAVTVVFLLCLVCFVAMMRIREQKRLQRRDRQQQSLDHYQRPPAHVHEKEAVQHSVWELDGTERPDLCAGVRTSRADSRRAGRPIFKPLSIHF